MSLHSVRTPQPDDGSPLDATVPPEATGDPDTDAPEVTGRAPEPEPWAMAEVVRLAGSRAEEHAARQLMAAFHRADIPAITLPSRIPTTHGYAELLAIPLALLAILTGMAVPWVGALALLLVVALYAAETAGEGLLVHIAPRRVGLSVLAAIPAQRRELRRLVVIAPLDTPPQWRWGGRTRATLRRLAPRLIVALALLACLLLILQFIAGAPSDDRWLVAPALGLLAILIVVGEPWPPASHAVPSESTRLIEPLLAFAAAVRAEPSHWVDVWCFAAAGGEVSGEAVRECIRDNALDVNTTFIINLARSDAPITFAQSEGPLWRRPSSPFMLRVLSRTSGTSPAKSLPVTTQAATAIARGYQAITLPVPGSGLPARDAIGTTVATLRATLQAIDDELVERNRVAVLARPSSRRSSRPIRPPQP